MEKKELANIINDLLGKIGFKKKGDYWVVNGDEITKMVNLQKSQFGNSFYINYGYILKSIPIDNLKMHVYKRLGSIHKIDQEKITALLNLDNDILDNDRENELKHYLNTKLISYIQEVNNEEDVFNELKKRPHLNDIPLSVKKHFNLMG